MDDRKNVDLPPLDTLGAERTRVAAADSDRDNTRRARGPVVVIAAVTFAVSAIVTFVATRAWWGEMEGHATAESSGSVRAQPRSTPTPPPAAGFAAHGLAFETVRGLVRESDLIVIGVVDENRVGEVRGAFPGDEFPTVTLHTTVAAEEILKGSDPDGLVMVPTDELAFKGPGLEDWREPGHRVLLFLDPSRESFEGHILAGLAYVQTVYFVRGQEIDMAVGGDITGLSERIGMMTVPDVRQAVAAYSDR